MQSRFDDGPGGSSSSAFGQAVLLGQHIDSVERQVRHLTDVLAELRRNQGAWLAGAEGEDRVVRVLVDMDDTGWHVLADRRWPGTRRANIDVLVVGPGGVFVIDVKTWRHPRVEHGRLWNGDAPADDDVAKLLDQTAAVEGVLADAGLPPAEVEPLLVLAGRRNATAHLGRVTMVGEKDLTRALIRRGDRLSGSQVDVLLTALQDACPPMPVTAQGSAPLRRPRTAPSHRPPRDEPPERRTGDDGLLPVEEVLRGLVEAAAREPIESWMTFLHPSQSRLINRRWSGAARIRGAAGTGKTVVALHRAKYLAAHGQRVLFTSFISTLIPVQESLFQRLAPQYGKRVEFASVFQVAMRMLRDRQVSVDEAATSTCFNLAWARSGSGPALAALGMPIDYWRDEVSKVIKGRGLTRFDQYAELSRVGRRTPLQPTHREAVWALYERYESLRRERGLVDWDDVLLLARDRALERRSDPPFDVVIVDEVQDLTCVALQFLHALAGRDGSGLLMVGDGQQSIYPGGFSLSEAGISVVGRSTVLQRNYRNRADILRHALALVADDLFDDLDQAPLAGGRDVEVERLGGELTTVRADDARSQETAMLADLREAHRRGARYGDMAVLTPSNARADRWLRALTCSGVPAMRLADYDGTPQDAVKVGTFHRSKGLEFARVFVPDSHQYPAPRRGNESSEAYRERAEIERRHMFVAMTRARDGLWLGAITAGGHRARDRPQSHP